MKHCVVQVGESDFDEPKMKFPSVVDIIRKKVLCRTHDSQSCDCSLICKKALDRRENCGAIRENDADTDTAGIDVDTLYEEVLAIHMEVKEDYVCYKGPLVPRPPFSNAFYEFQPRDISGFALSDRYRCEPSICCLCDGSTTDASVDYHMNCIKSSCGSGDDHFWNTSPYLEGNGIIVTEKYIYEAEVYSYHCSKAECGKKLYYDGVKDGIVMLHRRSKNGSRRPDGDFVLFDVDFLHSITDRVHHTKTTMSDIWSQLMIDYDRRFVRDDSRVSIQIFIKCLWTYWEYCVIPYIPTSTEICSVCGDSPKVLVFDGTSLGLLLRNLKEYHRCYKFNSRRDQPKLYDGFVQGQIPWSDLSCVTNSDG